MSSSLNEAIEALLQTKGGLKDPKKKSSDVAKGVLNAATKVNAAILSAGIPAILAEYAFNLKKGNDELVAQLNSVDATKIEKPWEAVNKAFDVFEEAARKFKEMSAVVGGGAGIQPILPNNAKHGILILAILLVIAGALCAAHGSEAIPAASFYATLSYWCGFTAFALAGVWVFANLANSKPFFASHPGGAPPSEIQYFVFGGMAFVVLGLLVAGVLTGDLLRFLQSIPGARGLITFLIAIGTIAIAVILTLGSVLIDTGTNHQVLKERLAAGKEILTVLVGVLGTIVGFYFANSGGTPAAEKMTIAFVEGPPTSVQPGQVFTISGKTTGGEMPYSATPTIKVGKGVMASNASVSEQGDVKVTFTVAKEAQPGLTTIEVIVQDKFGQKAPLKSDIRIEAKPATGGAGKDDTKNKVDKEKPRSKK
jgi:hypothetical protein